MIKYFCDRCGKETKKNAMVVQKEVARGGISDSVMFVFDTGMLCEECAEKFDVIKDKLEHVEDIFNMTDEDIELCLFNENEDEIRVEIHECNKRLLDLYERLYSIQKLKIINQHKN